MEFLFTKNTGWMQKWDNFLFEENCGSHLLYSDWLKSYASYGFDYEVLLVIDNGRISGGFGAVIAKSLFFKFYIIPHGPIFLSNYENHLHEVLNRMRMRAKEIGCCYAQYSLPVSDEAPIKNRAFSSGFIKRENIKADKGNLFKYVYSSYGINWVGFNNARTPEEFKNQLAAQVRRNINLSYKSNPVIYFANSEEECRLAYRAIEDNAIEGNYSVRSFDDFKGTIVNLVEKQKAYMIFAKVDGEVKGAGLAVS
ncbi:MAG TPA: hypothetical protein VFR70_03140, partial [Flavobacterium sp.]|nr:hypothetical protein [Flavobacterium sp.]